MLSGNEWNRWYPRGSRIQRRPTNASLEPADQRNHPGLCLRPSCSCCGLAEYDEMEGIAWRWQSIDGTMMKAPLAQEAVGPNPTDRGKNGSKGHLLVDGRGVPLSIVVTGANVNDCKRLTEVLDSIVVERENPPLRRSTHLCADAGYRGADNLRTIEEHGYIPHVVDQRTEADLKRRNPKKQARRWVVEVCHSWFNRFRKLLVRYEKLERSFIALNHLAAAIIAFRKVPLTIKLFTDKSLGYVIPFGKVVSIVFIGGSVNYLIRVSNIILEYFWQINPHNLFYRVYRCAIFIKH